MTEQERSGFALGFCATQPSNRLVSCDTATQTAVVNVVAGSLGNQTIPTFTNHAVQQSGTGTIKVCKQASGNGVTGAFHFTIGSTSVEANVGGCSLPLSVTVGHGGRRTYTQALW